MLLNQSLLELFPNTYKTMLVVYRCIIVEHLFLIDVFKELTLKKLIKQDIMNPDLIWLTIYVCEISGSEVNS